MDKSETEMGERYELERAERERVQLEQAATERVELERVEQELRHCLTHVPVPEGFTGRVMERVAAKRSAGKHAATTKSVRPFPALSGFYRHAAWWSAIAAVLLLAVGGNLVHVRHVREAQRQAEAEQQVNLAIDLTNRALGQVGDRLERSHAKRYTQIALELTR